MDEVIEYTVKVSPKGTKECYLTVECADGTKFWYLNGTQCTEAEFKLKLNLVEELSVAEISNLLGYEVKIVK